MSLVTPLRQWATRAVQGAWRLAEHEIDAAHGHWMALREHYRVAQRARDTTELLRDQVDLLPATQLRLASDHRQRMTLLRELWSEPGGAE